MAKSKAPKKKIVRKLPPTKSNENVLLACIARFLHRRGFTKSSKQIVRESKKQLGLQKPHFQKSIDLDLDEMFYEWQKQKDEMESDNESESSDSSDDSDSSDNESENEDEDMKDAEEKKENDGKEENQKKKKDEKIEKKSKSAPPPADTSSSSDSNTPEQSENISPEPASKPKKQREYFSRIDRSKISFENTALQDNTYKGAAGTWGEQASEKLGKVRGKDFTKNKNKMKKGSYKGGSITMASGSYKFE